MKQSIISSKPFLFRSAVLALATLAGAVACSSGSARDGFATSSNDATEAPGASGPPSPGAAGPDAGTSPPPEDCKKTEPSKACGVSPQCGCSTGKTCDVIDSSGNAKCVTAGTAAMGHPCTSTAGCAVGLTCVFGTCHAFCNAPGQACTQPGTGACVQVKTTDGADVPNLAVCRVACEPHDPKSCGGTTSEGTGVCNVDPDGNTECQTGGTKAEGEACSPTDPCGPGLACVGSEKEESKCRRWCRLGEDDCGADQSCVGFAPEVNVRGVAYGSCS